MPEARHYNHMSLLQTYRYKSLCATDEIRLLVLNPAQDINAPLSCSIVHYIRSAHNTEYSAVSYTWGDQEFIQTLEVVGDGNTISVIKITPTVVTILHHFRAPGEARSLWIDAIYLNQENHLEKADQIL